MPLFKKDKDSKESSNNLNVATNTSSSNSTSPSSPIGNNLSSGVKLGPAISTMASTLSKNFSSNNLKINTTTTTSSSATTSQDTSNIVLYQSDTIISVEEPNDATEKNNVVQVSSTHTSPPLNPVGRNKSFGDISEISETDSISVSEDEEMLKPNTLRKQASNLSSQIPQQFRPHSPPSTKSLSPFVDATTLADVPSSNILGRQGSSSPIIHQKSQSCIPELLNGSFSSVTPGNKFVSDIQTKEASILRRASSAKRSGSPRAIAFFDEKKFRYNIYEAELQQQLKENPTLQDFTTTEAFSIHHKPSPMKPQFPVELSPRGHNPSTSSSAENKGNEFLPLLDPSRDSSVSHLPYHVKEYVKLMFDDYTQVVHKDIWTFKHPSTYLSDFSSWNEQLLFPIDLKDHKEYSLVKKQLASSTGKTRMVPSKSRVLRNLITENPYLIHQQMLEQEQLQQQQLQKMKMPSVPSLATPPPIVSTPSPSVKSPYMLSPQTTMQSPTLLSPRTPRPGMLGKNEEEEGKSATRMIQRTKSSGSIFSEYIDTKLSHVDVLLSQEFTNKNSVLYIQEELDFASEVKHALSEQHETLNSIETALEGPLDLLKVHTISDFDGLNDENEVVHLLFEPKELLFDAYKSFGNLADTIFANVSIYNPQSNYTKLTETAKFIIKADDRQLMLDRSMRALFTISTSHLKNSYLFIKFSRLFQGDHETSVNDVYRKPEKAKDKDVKTYFTKSKTLTENTKEIISPFAWVAVKVSDALELQDCKVETLYYMKIFLSDAELLQAVLQEEPGKGVKNIPASFSFRLEKTKLPTIRKMTSKYELILPNQTCAREIPSIVHTSVKRLQLQLHNHCYIYPTQFNKQISHAYIMMEILLYENEDFSQLSDHFGTIRVFYNKTNNNPHHIALNNYALSEIVNMKNRTIKEQIFSDEIKFKLPTRLTDKHHLSFRFYSINAKTGVKTFIGCSFVRLMHPEYKHIYNYDMEIPIFSNVPSKQVYEAECEKFRNDTTGLLKGFKFHMTSHSIIHSDNRSVNEFVQYLDTIAANEFKNSNVSLRGTNPLEQLTKEKETTRILNPFFLNEFLVIASKTSDVTLKNQCFVYFIRLVDIFSDKAETILHFFLKNAFQISHFTETYLQGLLHVFHVADVKLNTILVRNSGFLLGILLKSMALEKESIATNESIIEKLEVLLQNYRTLMEKNGVTNQGYLVKSSFTYGMPTPKLAQIIASFLRRCFELLNKNFVLKCAAKWIDNYHNFMVSRYEEGDENLMQLLIETHLVYFKELFYYENMILLLLPKSHTADTIDDSCFLGQHFIFSQFLDWLCKGLQNSHLAIRLKTIFLFKDLVMNAEDDKRYQANPSARQLWMNCMFEAVLRIAMISSLWKNACSRRLKEAKEQMHVLWKRSNELESEINELKLQQQKQSNDATQRLLTSKKNEQGVFNQSVQFQETRIKAAQDIYLLESRSLMATVLHIISKMDQQVLAKWMLGGSLACKSNLIELLQISAKAFAYKGEVTILQQFAAQQQKTRKAEPDTIDTARSVEDVTSYKDDLTLRTNSDSKILKGTHGETLETRKGSLPDTRQSVDAPKPMSGISSQSNLESSSKDKWPRFFDLKKKKAHFCTLAYDFPQHDTATNVTRVSSFRSATATAAANTQSSSSVPSAPVAPPVPSLPNLQQVKKEDATLTMNDRVIIEKNISHESNLIILNTLTTFVRENRSLLLHHYTSEENESPEYILKSALIQQCIKVTCYCLASNQSETTCVITLSLIRALLHEFGHVMLKNSSKILEKLAQQLISCCDSKSALIREHAAGTFYILLLSHYTANHHSISKVRVLSTVALSIYLNRDFQTDMTFLKETIEKLNNFKLYDSSHHQHTEFYKELDRLCSTFQGLITNTMEKNKQGTDVYKIEDLYSKIVRGYVHIPEIRVVWYTQLAAFQQKRKQFCEAADCLLRVLCIVLRILRNAQHPILKHISLEQLFRGIASGPLHYIKEEEMASSLKLDSLGEVSSVPESHEFTLDGILHTCEKIGDLYEQADYYENSVEIYKFMLPFVERQFNYKKLSTLHEKLFQLYSKIDAALVDRRRVLGTYYKITFYGSKIGPEMDRKSFVYRFPKIFKLFQMVKYVKELSMEICRVEAEKIDKLDQKLDEEKVYFHVINVEPYFDEEELENMQFIEQNFKISKFYHETAFGKLKKRPETLADTFVRRNIITLEQTFPNMKTRLPVLSETEVILSPIENSIAMIHNRNQAMKEAIQAAERSDRLTSEILQNIQMLLQGAVKANVNGGPVSILQTFLDKKERIKYDAKHVQQLNDKLKLFIKLCEKANSFFKKSANSALQAEIETGFTETEKIFKQYLE